MSDKLSFQVGQWFDLVIYTASMEIYGAAVSDKLDMGRGLLIRRYFRQVSALGMDILHFDQY